MGEVEKGKKLVVCVIIISLSFEIITVLLKSAAGNDNIFGITQSAVRFTLECLLDYFLYKGYNWARIVSVILFGIAGIASIIFTFVAGWLLLVLGLPFMICACILISKPVKVYQRYKRTGNADLV